MQRLRVCNAAGCPTLTAARRCAPHRRVYDKGRGSRVQRGYGAAHRRERLRYAKQVAAGYVSCARCGRLVAAGQEWHLDHNETRDGYIGVSHARCNLSAAGTASHQR